MSTILIVEDDKNLQLTLAHILKEEGFEIITTMWGSMAIEEVKKGIPDLILLDIMLPGMNGLKVLEKVKEIDKKLPVIMITGYGNAERAIRAIELGAYDFVTKPFDFEKLISKINNAMYNNKRKKKGALLRHLKKCSLDIREYKEVFFNLFKRSY
jgi:DNA-binding NtrC family response regulator